MRDKIFQSLKQTYASKYGVGDDVLRSYADSLAATGLVTDENMQTVIQWQETALKAYQSSFDKIRGEKAIAEKRLAESEAQVKKTGGAPTSEPNNDTKPTAGGNDLADQITAAVAAAMKPLQDEITTLKSDKVAEIRQQKLKTIISKLPENLQKPYARVSVKDMSDEEFETLTSEIKTEVDGLVSDADAKGAVFGRPSSSNVKPQTGKEPSANEVDDVAKQLNL